MTSPLPSTWYDEVFTDNSKDEKRMKQYRDHLRFFAKHAYGNSLLDLGCGLGMLADMIGDREYLGIDFSHFAIEYCNKYTYNPYAKFIECKIEDYPIKKIYDTVVLSEVLEHVESPEKIVEIAFAHARFQIAGSVPVNMVAESHLKPKWTEEDIFSLFGLHPTILEQGCASDKNINIHWHFVFQF